MLIYVALHLSTVLLSSFTCHLLADYIPTPTPSYSYDLCYFPSYIIKEQDFIFVSVRFHLARFYL